MGGLLVNSRGSSIEITGLFTIGRAKDCRLRPEDPRLPPHLALIVPEGRRFVLFVLRPGPHLRLNRQPLTRCTVLRPGDWLRFGRSGWRFVSVPRESRAGPNGEAPPGPVRGPAAGERERWERLRRRFGLTQRETEVWYWLAQGKTYPEIASILRITVFTVHKHLEHLYAKLGVENRHCAQRLAWEAAGAMVDAA